MHLWRQSLLMKKVEKSPSALCKWSCQKIVMLYNTIQWQPNTDQLSSPHGKKRKEGRGGKGKEGKGQRHVGEKLVGPTEGTIEQQSSIMKVMAICTVRGSKPRRRTAAVHGILFVRRGFWANTSVAI